MKLSELQLPSNKSFGYFFASVFVLFSAYFFFKNSNQFFFIFLFLALTFLALSVFKSELLLPLNRLWMRFGLLLGMIVSPIVLGVIFFGLFAPVSLTMKLFGRDELRLKVSSRESFWKDKDADTMISNSFSNQF